MLLLKTATNINDWNVKNLLDTNDEGSPYSNGNSNNLSYIDFNSFIIEQSVVGIERATTLWQAAVLTYEL